MTGYKILYLDESGVLRSPFVRDFVWEVGKWMKPKHYVSVRDGYEATNGEPSLGLFCLKKPIVHKPIIERHLLALVEGSIQMGTYWHHPHFRQMRITGFYTGNIEETL